MIVGIEIRDCEHCAKVLIEWLKDHRAEMEKKLQAEITTEADILEHERFFEKGIFAIGYIDFRVVKNNRGV